MLSIIDLPVESQFMVIEYLDARSKHSLASTCRYLNLAVAPFRPSRTQTFESRLRKEQEDPTRYYRVCSKCIRLRQFFHFSLTQVSARTKPEKRICLDCYVSCTYNPGSPNLVRWFLETTIAVCPKCRTLVQCSREADPTAKANKLVVVNIKNHILPHPCIGNGNAPQGPQIASVNHLRSELEHWEARLPDRKLVMMRPSNYSHSKSFLEEAPDWEDFLRVLRNLATIYDRDQKAKEKLRKALLGYNRAPEVKREEH